MWEFINKFIYINLDDREDRQKIMETFFEKGKIPLEKVIRFSAIKRDKGEVGCLESHTECLKMAKKEGWKNVLILEDDLEWLDFESEYPKLEELTKLPNWHVILLLGWYWEYKFPRIYDSSNAGAYLVNSDYYDILLNNRLKCIRNLTTKSFNFFNKKAFETDRGWKSLQKVHNWYGLNPCICRQVDGFSDHCGKHIKASLVYGIGTSETKNAVYG
jgi:GR25 family glycosyltransferase involved in LPS biosynthesis